MKRVTLFLAVAMFFLLAKSGRASCFDCKLFIDCSKPDCIISEICTKARWLTGFESCYVSQWGTCTSSNPCQYASTSQDERAVLLASLMEPSPSSVSCSSGMGAQSGS